MCSRLGEAKSVINVAGGEPGRDHSKMKIVILINRAIGDFQMQNNAMTLAFQDYSG